METITDTTQRFTEDDLARLLVEFEKHINLYQFLVDRLCTLLDSDQADKESDANHLYRHCLKESDEVDRLAELVPAIAMQACTVDNEWCAYEEPDDSWSVQHKRYATLLDQHLSAYKLVQSKMLRFIVSNNELKTMEDFANGKEL